jgi:hypothetical protein
MWRSLSVGAHDNRGYLEAALRELEHGRDGYHVMMGSYGAISLGNMSLDNKPTPVGHRCMWQYWPPKGPAPNSDFLFYIRVPHVCAFNMRELVS